MSVESNRIEYKVCLNDKLEKEVVGFLNYHEGGIIYIGIDKEGNYVGVDEADSVQLQISDRIVITSSGSLPQSLTQDEFFSGVSAPRNKELMRVFKDLKIVEQLGSGMMRILKRYDRSIFDISTNFMKVTFKFDEEKFLEKFPVKFRGNKSQKIILDEVLKNNRITQSELAVIIGISERAVRKNMDTLKQLGLLKRIGSDKDGYWEVTND